MDPLTARVQESLDRVTVSILRRSTGAIPDEEDGEPSSSQGLRLIHAFAKIRNNKLRNDIVAMIEAIAACGGVKDNLLS